MQNGGLEPQEVSVLHLVAQLRMQDGKLESLVQGTWTSYMSMTYRA